MITTATIVASLMPVLAAQQPGSQAPTNIAVVNLAAVFEKYQMTRDLEERFGRRREEVKAESRGKQENIALLRNALEQFKPGTADFRQREEELVRSEIEFEVWLEVQERRLKSEHKSWLESIYRNTQEVVARIAAQRGIDLVLTYNDLEEDAPDSLAFKQQILLRTVIFASPRTDVTAPVIETLDAEYRNSGGTAALDGLLGSNPAAMTGGRNDK